MPGLFSSVKMRRPRRNKFDLSHERKLSFNMGKLIPIMMQEIVPGDKFRVQSEVMLRFAPLLAPIMHRVNVTTHYFFVPNRLIWDEWEDFITGGREGTSAPVWPFIRINDNTDQEFQRGSLADYLGIPPIETLGVTQGLDISALPFRAYQLVWDEYYRDQNLLASLGLLKTSGQQTTGETTKITTLRDRAWEKDYFTSALPWAQRGGQVEIPFGDAGIQYKDESLVVNSFTDTLLNGPNYMQIAPTVSGGTAKVPGGLQIGDSTGTGVTAGQQVRIENIESIQPSATINELRRSIRLQEWLEKNARGGARYVEQILSHFGVRSSDARLQRPEYLGGGRNPVVISEVLSTASSYNEAGDQQGMPQANMAGHGVSFGTTNGFRRSFEEHGFVVGMLSVLPKTAYQNGVNKMWSRSDKFDYYWPEFANIGEQEIKEKEIFWNANVATTPDATWGYQSRYAEYKYTPSTVHGEMRDELSYWHMGRIFSGAAPPLNNDFVTSNPTTRIFSVEAPSTVDHLYCQLYNRVDAIRPMPYFGTPML